MLTFPGAGEARPAVAFEVAGSEYGDIYLARTLALANVLDGWADVSFSTEIPSHLMAGYRGFRPTAPGVIDAIVIDTPERQRRDALVTQAREGGQRSILVTDDPTELRPDVVIAPVLPPMGPNRGLDDGPYSLLGPSFAMLHPAFRPRDAAPNTARRAVVALGDASTPEVLRSVLNGLRTLNLEVDVLLPTGLDLPRFSPGIDVYVAQPADSTARLLRAADVAIVSTGPSSLEALATATPMAVIATTDDQEPVAEWFESLGVGRNLGPAIGVTDLDVRDAVRDLTDAAGVVDRFERAVDLDSANGCQRISTALADVLRPVATA